MSVDELAENIGLLGESANNLGKLAKFVYATRGCLYDREDQPFQIDKNYAKAVENLSLCGGLTLFRYAAMLRSMAEKRSDSCMPRIYERFLAEFQDRLTPS